MKAVVGDGCNYSVWFVDVSDIPVPTDFSANDRQQILLRVKEEMMTNGFWDNVEMEDEDLNKCEIYILDVDECFRLRRAYESVDWPTSEAELWSGYMMFMHITKSFARRLVQ